MERVFEAPEGKSVRQAPGMAKHIRSASSMLLIRRVLLAVIELGVLLLGIILSLAVASSIAVANGCYNSDECPVASATLISGALLTIAGFVFLRRRNRLGSRPSRAQTAPHPRQVQTYRLANHDLGAQCDRRLRAVFLSGGDPPGVPAFAILEALPRPDTVDFAVLSSLGQPAEYSYVQVLAPENGKGIFSVQRFWVGEGFSSRMIFGSIQPDADTFELNHGLMESKRAGAAMVSTREFRLGDAAFTCWQYVNRRDRRDIGLQWWDVDCETPVAMHQNNLYAWFVGRKQDIAAFYGIIEGIAPVKQLFH